MKHSALKKHEHANYGVSCSSKKLCYACKHERKAHKRFNNKAIRRINKALCKPTA